MPMTPLVTRFPELGARETRALRVSGRKELPDGDYGFLELYCDEPGCDCRRVMIDVLREDTEDKIWATLNYGWENLEFYRQWGRCSSDREARAMKGPVLDPLNPQTQYSRVLLERFRIFLQSPDYVQRLKQHYQMFRAAVEEEQLERPVRKQQQVENPSKRLRHSRYRRQP
jgi:hypothetical protein